MYISLKLFVCSRKKRMGTKIMFTVVKRGRISQNIFFRFAGKTLGLCKIFSSHYNFKSLRLLYSFAFSVHTSHNKPMLIAGC